MITPPPKSFALLAPQGDIYSKVHHYRSRSSDGNSGHVRAITFHVKTKFGPNHCNIVKATQGNETKNAKTNKLLKFPEK